jgi:hypothetical protein
MHQGHEDILKSLRFRIEKLISLYETEKSKNLALQENGLALQKQLVEKEKELEELQTKYNNLRLAKTLIGDVDDSHEAKFKINRIVREIDKCIALLNK